MTLALLIQGHAVPAATSRAQPSPSTHQHAVHNPVRTHALRQRRRARPGEQLLLDALDREARAPQGRLAVVVRLSHLPAPGPRPYHRRVARALLEDCAQRHGGQVLQLGTGDLVLLAPPPPRDAGDGPLALPGLLARLLHAEGEAGETLVFAAPVAEAEAKLRALAEDPAAAVIDEPAAATPRNPFAGRLSPGFAPLPGDAVARALSGGIAPLLQRTAVARLPFRGEAQGLHIRPTHRMLAIAPAQLAARLAATHGEPGADLPPDPWLRQHIEVELGRALLGLARQAWGTGTPVDAAPRPHGGQHVPPMLLRLPLAALAGEDFAAFAALPHGPAAPAIAISIAEAAADAPAFAAARVALHEAGMTLVLDGLTHHALVLARPEALGPDLVALGWSSALPRLPEARRQEVTDAILRIGPGRVMLTGADSEAALRWGRAAGIQLFQGAHVDAMLAATRLLSCPRSAACGLRACTERGTAATAVGRAGCSRPDLLDHAAAEHAAGPRAGLHHAATERRAAAAHPVA